MKNYQNNGYKMQRSDEDLSQIQASRWAIAQLVSFSGDHLNTLEAQEVLEVLVEEGCVKLDDEAQNLEMDVDPMILRQHVERYLAQD